MALVQFLKDSANKNGVEYIGQALTDANLTLPVPQVRSFRDAARSGRTGDGLIYRQHQIIGRLRRDTDAVDYKSYLMKRMNCDRVAPKSKPSLKAGRYSREQIKLPSGMLFDWRDSWANNLAMIMWDLSDVS